PFSNLSPILYYPLSLHDALPILQEGLPLRLFERVGGDRGQLAQQPDRGQLDLIVVGRVQGILVLRGEGVDHAGQHRHRMGVAREDRKSTRLNSSHVSISYAVFWY